MSRKQRIPTKKFVITDLVTNEYLVNQEYDYNSAIQKNIVILEFSKIVDTCKLYTKHRACQIILLWSQDYIILDKNTNSNFDPTRLGIKRAKSITVLV